MLIEWPFSVFYDASPLYRNLPYNERMAKIGRITVVKLHMLNKYL